jgi:lipopolysaccharide/colanic/teichoic acid biosynthesis glycosyltransferase
MVSIMYDSQLIVLHETHSRQEPYSLAAMLANEPLGAVLIDGLLASRCCGRAHVVAPDSWGLKASGKRQHVLQYSDRIPLTNGLLENKRNSYLILSDGRFQTDVDYSWLRNVVSSCQTDAVLVDIEPMLSANQDKFRLTSQGHLAGIRRVYSDSAQEVPIPTVWPCHVFIRKSLLPRIFNAGSVPADFGKFLELLSKSVSVRSISVGGVLLDIETPQGLLAFVAKSLKFSPMAGGLVAASASSNTIPASTRRDREVVIGRNVRIGENASLIGPVIIGDSANIGDGAVVVRSIIGSGVRIEPMKIVHDQLLVKDPDSGEVQEFKQCAFAVSCSTRNNFKAWPRLSYARFVKRMFDIVFAAGVLILFAPVIAIIALIIKATSHGPVFFGHQRQGLHGGNFGCLKFRSMIVGADDLQHRLRAKNEVDGPQFKMDDDPRVTPIGKFLRDTYLDEIPQFFNVLFGNMSVVGPRPSPEAENSLCAYWRDARLSVRPGITGLWQMCRTRKSGSDFQEWVHYDSQYVRQLSLKLDLWIFWKTSRYLVRTFLRQF